MPRETGTPQRSANRSRRRFVAEEFEHRGIGPDENQACFEAGAGESGVLAEKAIAGMHGLAAFGARQRDDLLDVEIGLRPRPPQRRAPGRRDAVKRGRVILGEDRDRSNAEFRRRARDSDRDLAAIGDQSDLIVMSESISGVVAAESA